MTNPHLLIMDEATEGLAPLIEKTALLATPRQQGHSGDRQRATPGHAA
jgi:ABC-type branched-subunit amino acid transport system ATPase component